MNRQNILLVAATTATACELALPALMVQGGRQRPGPSPAPRPQTACPRVAAGIQQSFAPDRRRTAPAVVNVYSSVTVSRSNCPYANDPFSAASSAATQSADRGRSTTRSARASSSAPTASSSPTTTWSKRGRGDSASCSPTAANSRPRW